VNVEVVEVVGVGVEGGEVVTGNSIGPEEMK
jgi:hypothetical protein